MKHFSRVAKSMVAVALAGCVVIMLVVAQGPAVAAAGDVGYQDQSYSGSSPAPTADKPESKLWFAAGRWWAVMFHSVSGTWHIFRLDRSTERWADTGVAADSRPDTHADALWNGSHLFIASHVVTASSTTKVVPSTAGTPARLFRYSFDQATDRFNLDQGFPLDINASSSESLTIDQDSTGRLWATWTQVTGTPSSYSSTVYVNSSSPGGTSWAQPLPLPVSGAHPSVDDISAVVAFGQSKIGVMWSNQLDDTVYWAVHVDGAQPDQWTGSVATRGSKAADDHINLKTVQADSSGRVFATVKTSLDDDPATPQTAPQINLLVFRPGTGSWSSTVVGVISDCHTRPIVVLDDEHSVVHVFATAPSTDGCPGSGTPGSIYEKTAPMSNPVFSPGRGTVVIRDAAAAGMNDATSTKQPVDGASGLVVLASNQQTQRYWHLDHALSPGAPVASFSSSVASGPAPLAVSFSDTSTGAPTTWSWDFGDGSTSSAQSPTHTFSAAGTFAVRLVVANAGGSSSATANITVSSSGTVDPSLIPGNLLTVNAQSMETSVAPWTSLGSTTQAATTTAYDGVQALAVTLNATKTVSVIKASRVPATGGTTYTYSTWLRTTNAGRNAKVYLNWYDTASQVISGSLGPTTPLPQNTWIQLTITGTAPARTSTVLPVIDYVGGTTGETFTQDRNLLVSGS